MVNNLFDKKNLNDFVEKYDSLLKIDNEKREALNKWNEMLISNELTDEEGNYGNFQDIVLRQILGYSIDDFTTNYTTEGNESVEFVLYNKYKDPYVAIELKGSNTNLMKYRNHKGETPMQQASRYATSAKSFKWCIACNYDTFIFFNKNSREEYISFNFSDLSNQTKLKQFLLIFSKSSLIDADVPSILLEESRDIDKDFEDEFYKLFSETRLMLIKELEFTSNLNKDEAIHYAQLILNRYIFICFAEDKGLIPHDTNRDTITTPLKIGNLSHKKPRIWQRLNELFDDIDEGRTAKNISAFNGGFFKEDLSQLTIRDYVEDDFFEDCKIKWKFEDKDLEQITKSMHNRENINPIYFNLLLIAHFNFNTELDVNILGHIFENSIGDIENIKNGKENKEIISERNKLGVFYTPDPITEHICNNTIIPFLSKSHNVNTISDLINEYYDKDNYDFLDELDDKLRDIKILDPSCGSGAFLNKATDILLEIHSRIHHIKAEQNAIYVTTKKRKGRKSETAKYYQLDTFDDNLKRREIVLNNVYGVDINPESVELTKLGMFLKVAKKGLKLPTLDKNIKCGNSLIDDKVVAGESAFDWEFEFKEVFKNGGFDVIIGNPPYVATKLIPEIDRNYYWEKYKDVLFSEMDLYEIFMFKSLNYLLKDKGYLGFITPNSFYAINSFKKLREFILTHTSIIEIIDFPYRFYPFEEVNTETTISIYRKHYDKNNLCNLKIVDKKLQEKTGNLVNVFKNEDIIKQEDILNLLDGIIVIKPDMLVIKLLKNPMRFKDYTTLHKGWMSVPSVVQTDNIFYDKGIFHFDEIKNDEFLLSNCNKYLEGKDIHRYYADDVDKYVYIKDIAKNTKSWHFSRKIILQRIVGQNKNKISATLDFENNIIFPNANLVNVNSDNNHNIALFLGILNSKLISFYWDRFIGESNTNITKKAFESIPIPDLSELSEDKISKYVFKIISTLKELNIIKNKFFNKVLININREIIINTKIQNFEKLDFIDFADEIINKQKIEFSLDKQDEWEDYFNNAKEKCLEIQSQIKQLDDKINKLVYELYNLNPEEINIIENSFN